MNAECPQCAESDQTVNVPHALADAVHPLGEPERGRLLPPPPPPPTAAAGHSKPAIALYAVAGVITVLWLMNMANGLPDLEDADTSYRMGYLLGPLVFSVPLALAGLVVQLATKQRRIRLAGDSAGAWHTAWERRHWVWQTAWLCRRCRVAFFPHGAISPDYPASPAIAVAQLPTWVTTTAERAFGVPESAAPR
ncbi:hypothetical protein [Kitasatospora sp. NBC_00315]|uniref:hypothetical protein n=1 Tax=Kitasatospora sp. NBC_00315 TaxID=2975963 RepID=UPI00324BF73D